MRLSLLLVLFNTILAFNVIAQTTLLIDAGPGPYNNIDGQILDSYDADISDCSSVQFSISFSFSLPWEGTGGMEFCTECVGNCACDPTNPGSPGCATPVPCWDFMWMQFFIGGQLEDENLIGDADTDNSENFGIYTTPIICTDGEQTASIEVTNQNWAIDETNEFSNVALICWEGIPSVTTATDPVCLGSDIQLTSNSDDAVSWSWDGPNGFSSSQENPLVTGSDLPTIPDDYIYSLTITDSNGCDATDEVEITISNEVDTGLDAIDTDPCEDVDIELEETGGEALTWSWIGPDGFSSSLQFPVVSPPNLPDAGTHTYEVTVTDSDGCTGAGVIDITVHPLPAADADADNTMVCLGADILLEEDGGNGDQWSWQGPSGFTSTIENPIVTGTELPGLGTHTYNVTVTDINGCTQTDFIDIEVTPAPTAQASATSSTICVGQNIELQEISNVFNTYTWTGPMGYTSNVQNPIISGSDLPGIGTHTYTVNAIDASGCMDTDEIEITVNATVTATLTTPAGGDVIVCDGECATTEYIVELELTGGVAPYTVDIGIVGVPIPIPLPAIDVNQTFIQICNGPLGFDFNSDPLQITLPDFAFGTSLEITNVVDSGGCNGTISGGSVSLILMDNPSIQPPNVMTECLQQGETIDLTQYDAEIGNGLDVLWLRSEDEDDPIDNPDTYDIDDGDMVYAVVRDDPCISDIISVQLERFLRPEITLEMPIINICGNEFELPQIDEVANVENEVFPQYYQSNDFSVSGLNPTTPITVPDGASTIYLYDESGAGCFDAQPIEVISNPLPEILSPSGTLSECGSIILPNPVINNDNDLEFEYNTEPDGSGRSFSEDDELEASDGIDMLFLIATNRGGTLNCVDTTHIMLEFHGVNFSAVVPSQICDTLILPEITPASPTAGFFTVLSNGDIFLPGDTISFEQANATSNRLDTLFLFDPTQSGVCATVDTIVFEIGQTPNLDIVIQRQFCDAGTLPLPNADNPNLQYSTNRDFLPGTILDPTMPITSSTQIFYRDSIAFLSGGACFAIDSFDLEIISAPNAGQNNEVNLCEGTNLVVDLFDLLGQPDQSGMFSTQSVIPDLDFSNPNQVDLSVLIPGNYTIDYIVEVNGCLPSASTLLVNVSDLPFEGTPFDESICRIATEIDLTQLLTDEEAGGEWFYTTSQQSMQPINDPTIFDVFNIQDDTISIIYLVSTGDPTEMCDGAMSVSTLRLTDAPNAGLDGASTICIGQAIDLNTIISADADAGGTFLQDGFDVIDPMNWLPLTINQNVVITYIIESAVSVCPSDTATIDITISDMLTAGIPITEAGVCENIPIFLSDRIDGESPGGNFFLESDLNTPLPEEWIPSSDETFLYITPDATGCDPDTSTFTIEVNEAPLIASTTSTMDICAGSQDCINLELSSNKDGQLILEILGNPNNQERIDLDVVLSPGNTTLRLCPSEIFNEPFSVTDSLFIGSGGEITVNTISFEDDSGICPTIPLNQQHIINVRSEFLMEIDTTVCEGENIEIDGQFFTRDTIINVLTSFGCDSTIVITINEETTSIENISRQLCDGQQFDDIAGFSFSSNIDTMIVLDGESQSGCDSIINLTLDFQDVTVGILTPILCDGEFIEIDGVVIDASNSNADIPSPEMSVFGCDSVTNVMAVFLPLPMVGTDSLTLCPDESETIGDITYDINTTSGTSLIINGSAVGCDSMVNVTVNIVQEVFDLNFDLCANDTLTVGNDTYTASNTSGMSDTELLSVFGCDSIINVNINVLDLDERMISRELCEDEDFIFGNETFNFSNPSGLTTVSNPTGCDSLFIVNITELRKDEIILEPSFCVDQDTIINGIIYNADNTMGQSILINEFGCDSIVIVNLSVGSTRAILETNICPGEVSGTLQIVNTEGLSFPLSLDIPSAAISLVVNDLPFEIDLTVGIHEVTLDDGECTYMETIQLVESNTPILSILADTLTDNSWQLSIDSGQNIIDYSWQTSAELDCNNCPSTTVTSDIPTTVTLNIVTDTGCNFSSSIELNPFLDIIDQDTIIKIFLPTAILLSDSQNDRFVIRSNVDLEIDRLSIYDRWGNLVFNNENFLTDVIEEGWDGRRNGVEIEQGVYVFLIEYEDPVFGPELLHGSITIIR